MRSGKREIKRLAADDAAAMCAVVARFKCAEITEDYAHDWLSENKNILIAAHIDNVPAGFLIGYEMMRVDRPQPMMILYEIETAEEFRRKGLGRAMVEEFLHVCKERDFLKAWVPTNAGNTAALALYSSAGGQRMMDEADLPVTFTWYSAEPTAYG